MPVVVMEDTYELLRERIEELQEELRKNQDEIQRTAGFGDLSENAEYDSAKEKQGMLHYKLNQLKMYMNVDIFTKDEVSTDTVSFGTAVKLEDLNTGEIKRYTVMGPAEYELGNYPNIMTYTSPLAKAMIGKEQGDIAEIKKPDKHLKYEIQEIKPAWEVKSNSEE